MNGIESAREEERRRRTAQINLPLDFNNRIEPADTEIGKCACVCCCFILFLERGREHQTGGTEGGGGGGGEGASPWR